MSAASVPRLWSLVFGAIWSGAWGGPSVAVVGVVFLGSPVVGVGLSGSAGGGDGRDSGERGGDLVCPGPG